MHTHTYIYIIKYQGNIYNIKAAREAPCKAGSK